MLARLMKQEEVVRHALENGRDPHRAYAAHMHSIVEGAVTTDHYQQAKMANHHLLYSDAFLKSVKWPPEHRHTGPCPYDGWKSARDVA